MEIAKLRALRIVWQALANEYTNSRECIILAQPGIRNKTLYDYNVNLLRSTTECMSAILGGANYVSNLLMIPFITNTTSFQTELHETNCLYLNTKVILIKLKIQPMGPIISNHLRIN